MLDFSKRTNLAIPLTVILFVCTGVTIAFGAVQEAQTYRKDLIPEARMSLDATFASYRVGRADFSSLFQAETELLNLERTARMAETAAAQARVDAEAMVGTGVE